MTLVVSGPLYYSGLPGIVGESLLLKFFQQLAYDVIKLIDKIPMRTGVVFP